MISYDNYKNRIVKLAKFRRVLHKFRFLICGVLALIVGTSVGLMCAKGAYTSDMTLSAQTVYFNEYYEVTAAKAFLASSSEQHIEYRDVKNGGDWTTEKPVKASKYAARTVTKKIVGYSYSSEVNFEILPIEAEMTITGTSMTYGDVHNYSLSHLVAGHRVDESVLAFKYAEYGAVSTEVDVDLDTLKIVDEKGDDFTDCYDITTVPKTLTIRKKNITVTPVGYEFTYDAQPHDTDDKVTEETFAGLVSGDTLSVRTSVGEGGAVNAGGYIVQLDSVSILHGGKDVAAWYNVTYGYSLLTISPRKLNIKTADAEKVYDGEPVVQPEFTHENLVAGHMVNADLTTLSTETDVGTYKNEFGVKVFDGLTDVTNNYEIVCNAGTLKITSARLTVTTSTPEAHTYDGKPFTDFNFELEKAAGANFTVEAVERLATDTTDAGEYANAFAVEVILNGKPVTKNFEIKYNYGKLTVKQRDIDVHTFGDTKVYDGTPLSCGEHSENGVVAGHSLKLVTAFSVTDVTGENGVQNDTKFTVIDEHGKDVGKNYIINYIRGKLVIEPRHIVVTTNSKTKEYDGTALSDGGYTTDIEGGALYNGDKLNLKGSPAEITQAGFVSNNNDYTVPSANYVIDEIIYGTLTIEPKAVIITVSSVTAVYGEEILVPAHDFELVGGERLSFTTHFERDGEIRTPETWQGYTLLDAGTYFIVYSGDAKVTGGNANLDNYNITYIDGILEITARGIVVTTATASHIYDGNDFSDTSYTTAYADGGGLGLLNGDELTVNSYMTVKTIDDIPTPNVVTYAVPNDNYRITKTEYGTLTIIPRPVIVYTGSAEKEYDGTPLSCEEYTVKYAAEVDGEWVADDSKTGLIDGDSLELTNLVEKTHAGVYDNANKYANGNYNVVRYVNGKLTVTKKPLHVKLAGGTLNCEYGTVFEPYAYSANAFVDAESGEPVMFDDGYKLVVEWKVVGASSTGAPDVGTYTLKPNKIQTYKGEWTYDQYGRPSASDIDSIGDYNVTCDDATLVIEKLKVEVTVKDMTATYGGKLPSFSKFNFGDEYTYPDKIDNILTYKVSQSLQFEFGYEEENVKNVGEYHFAIKSVTVENGKASNYDVTCSGTLTITPAELTVKFWYNTVTKPERIEYGTEWTYPTGAGNYKTNNDTVSGLVNGEEIEIAVKIFSVSLEDYVEKPVKVGKYSITVDALNCKIYAADGSEIENGIRNYTFKSVMSGNLSVEPKKITVTIDDASVVYGEPTDGKTYGYTVAEELPYGDELLIESFIYTKDGAKVTPKDAGEYSIEGDQVLVNGTADGADNYYITYKGTLTVDKLVLNIRPGFGGYSITYGNFIGCYSMTTDGQRFFDLVEDGEVLQLPYGEDLFVQWRIEGVGEDEAAPVKEGGHVLSAHSFKIYQGERWSFNLLDEGDGEHLKNYIINCEDSHLTVAPLVVDVDVKDLTIEYGDALPETFEYEYADKYTQFYPDNFHLSRLGVTMEFEIGLDGEVKDFGEYPFVIKGVKVFDKNGVLKEGDENNYKFVCNGTLTVTRKVIYTHIEEVNQEYGGDLSVVTWWFEDSNGVRITEFPNGDRVELDDFFYYNPDGKLVGWAKDNPRLGVGEYWCHYNSEVFTNADGEDCRQNYCNYARSGKVIITPKNINVRLSDIDNVTYGETFSYPEGVGNYANAGTLELAYGERLEVAVEYLVDGVVGTPKNANTYGGAKYSARINASACTVYESDGETVIENGTDNYNITCAGINGLTINLCRVNFYVDDLSAVYGELGVTVNYPKGVGNYKRAEYLYGGGYTEDAPYGELFEIGVDYLDDDLYVCNPKNVGTYLIKFSLVKTKGYESDGKTAANLANYVFWDTEPYMGTLEISPKDIRITLSDVEVDYGEFNASTYPDKVDNYDLSNSTEPAYSEKFKVSVKYQQTVDGKLVDVTPKNAGSYLIAGVDFAVYDGDKLADKNNYNFVGYTAGTLTIHKKTIYILIDDKSCIYGEDIPENSYTINKVLPYGDKIEVLEYKYWLDGYGYVETPRNAGEYDITVEKCSITNGGVGVKDNYTLYSGISTLTIEKADLKITLPQISSLKYGDELSYPYDDIAVVGLRYNEALKVAVKYLDGDGNTVTPVNAGTYTVVLDEDNCKIKNEDGTDGLLSNYEIECEEVEFDIAKREITVYLKADKTNIYYGDDLPEVTFTIYEEGNEGAEYTLPNNDEITFGYRYLNLETNEYETPKNVGTYQVEIEKTFVDGVLQTKDNSNYTVGYYDVWITIRKYGFRPVINDFSVVYGNEIPYYFGVSAEETEKLPYGEKVIIEVRYLKDDKEVTPVNVGVYDIDVINYTVYGEDGVEIVNGTDNYYFEPDCGQMEITALEVTVTVNDQTATYGDDISKLENGFTVDIEMPYGEEFELSYSCDLENPNADEYENAITATVVGVIGGNASLDNYSVTEVIAGKLTVTQREITVKVSGGTAVYGYEKLPEIKHEITLGEMVGEEKLVPAYVFSLNGTECEPVNAGAYDISVDEENTAVEGGNALYSNYAVTYVYDGKFVVTASLLTVKIIGDSFTYGDRKANVTFEIAEGELFHGDNLELTYKYNNETEEPTAAGTYAITATAEITGGNARVENYEITCVNGTLEIAKRAITVTLNRGGVTEFTYGTPYSGDILNAEIEGAAAGQTIAVAVTYTKAQETVRLLRARAFSVRAAETLIPKDAGTYIASLDFDNCVVTDGNGEVDGGIANYELSAACADVEFTITPMTLTVEVSNAEITYGDKLPSALAYEVAEEMPEGESLELTFSFAGDDDKLPAHVGTYPVKIAEKSINGGKISNYTLSYTNNQPELTINEKAVRIRANDLTVPYGTEVLYRIGANNYRQTSSDSLADGDELTVTEVLYRGEDGTQYPSANAPENAGAYVIVIVNYKIVNAEGEDATADYVVTKLNGTLNISSSVIIVYTADAEKEYDGTPLSTDEYSSYEGDLHGYTLVADENAICEQTDVTTGAGVDNTTRFKIVDENGVETDNLEIRYGADNKTYGKLKVLPRRIEIKSDSASKPYDGTALTAGYTLVYKGVNAGSEPLAATDSFTVTGTGSQTDAGSSENTVFFTLTNIGNYVIEPNFGTLTVTRKLVYVTINSGSSIYGVQPEIGHTTDVALADGEELEFEVEYRKDGVKVTPEQSAGFRLPAGNYRAYYADGTASIVGGRENAENYSFVFTLGADFEVTPRHIAVFTADASHEYDGSEFYCYDDYTTGWMVDGKFQGEAGLLDDDVLTVEEYATITEVGSKLNRCTYSVSDNYVIDEDLCDYGTLSVTKRTITVKTADIVETYDGYAHSSGVITDPDNKLVGGHTFVVTSGLVAPVDVCSGVVNELTVKIFDGETDVTDNYDITYDYGTITIKQRTLTITTGKVEGVTYDGQPHGETAYENAEGLLSDEFGHTLVVDTEFTYTNATEGVDNKTTYKVFCGDKDLTGNYDIKYICGKIIINKLPVTVTLIENVQVQYGDDYAQALQGEIELVNGETVSLAVTTDRAVDGTGFYTATAVWSDSVVRNSDGNEIENGADNYEPGLVPATALFEVTARKIKVTLNADGNTQFAYGDDYDTAMRTVTVASMSNGETLNVAVNYVKVGESDFCTPKFVGTYKAQINGDGCTVEGGNIDNYEIVLCNDVTFEIIPKELTVDMADITVEYDEEPAYADGENGYTKVEGLVYGDTVKVIPAFEKDGVRVTPDFSGEYDIVCGGIVVNGGAVGAENYAFKTGESGTLTVKGVGIVIVRKTVTKTYDGEPLELHTNAPENEVTYKIKGNSDLKLPDGYHLELDGAFATADGFVSSSCANTANYKVVVEATGETAGNYIISYENNGARLEIEQRVINVTTDDATRAYDGTALTADCTYSTDELVEGHELTTFNHAQITNVGSTPNTMRFTVTADGEDVTANYDIKVTTGTLTVEKRAVTVEIADITKVYGEDVGASKVYTQTLVNNEKLYFRVKFLKEGELCDTTKQFNAGVYDVTGDRGNMSVSGGGKLSNYDISFEEGATLTVTQRHIIVTTATASAEYSGEEFFKHDGYTTLWVVDGESKRKTGLVNGDELTVEEYATQTVVGSCENVCDYTVSENYVIDGYVWGTLTVTQRTITVTTNGISGKEYCGTAYTDGGFTHDNKLLDGHEIKLSGKLTEFLDATDGAENKFEVVITAAGVDVTEYYKIKYNYGKVYISKRALTVTLNGAQTEFVYGDGSFDEKFKLVSTDGLAEGDGLTTVALKYTTADGKAVNGVPVNAGSYKVRLDTENSFIDYAGDGNGIGNYEIECEAVGFEISRLEITLALKEWADGVYDGDAHAYDGSKWEITAGGLLDGEEIESVAVKYFTSADKSVPAGIPKDAGTYYVFPDETATMVSGANGKTAIFANYDVNYTYITYTIEPKKLVIKLSNVSHTYDGAEFDFAASDGFEISLCDGDEIELNFTYSATPVNAGTYDVTLDTTNIAFTSGKAGNYEFDGAASKTACTLTIEEREITVTVADRNVEKGKDEYTKAYITSVAADGGEGFVNGDLDKATVTFTYTDILPKPAGAVEYKAVSVTFGGDVMKNYNVTTLNAGTLTVTERKVLVTPVFGGSTPYIYDGNAVDGELFAYTHVHNVDDFAEGDGYGFTEADAAKFTAVFTFTDENGNAVEGTPVNAGTYTVSVRLSGDGIDSYQITYEDAELTIERRQLSYTVAVQGTTRYEYSNSCPDLESIATLAEYDGFAGGLPEYEFELFDGDNAVTRYNVGTYQVKIKFEGMENYVISATTAEVTIVPRVLVVTPVDPYGGAAQPYNGTNLALGGSDYTVRSGEVAEGDKLAIVSTGLAPTSSSGNLTIDEVIITDEESGEDIRGNYTVYSTYDAANATIKSLNLLATHFRVRVSYEQTEIHYTLGEVGKSFPYTGKSFTYTFETEGAVSLSDGETLGFGHVIKMSKNSVTVRAAAGEYTDLITDLVRVYDADDRNVTAIYKLVCDNPENGVIYVTENKLSVDFTDVEELTVGKMECAVSGLYEGASPAHQAEVYAFNLDGEWLIGVTVFSENASGRKTDLSANYKLDESCAFDGATVKIITLAEADEYARPALSVEITVDKSTLESGKGTLYNSDDDGRWVLQSGYTVSGGLEEGHEVQVLVFREDGEYLLGVTVFKLEDETRKEAGDSYRITVKSEVAARYITVSEATSLKRELYVDFSGAFNDDGTPKTEDGLLTGYVAEGVYTADSHVLEITVTENDDGTYTLNVVVYQLRRNGSTYRKYNKAAVYELVYTAPDGVTAEIVTGALN